MLKLTILLLIFSCNDASFHTEGDIATAKSTTGTNPKETPDPGSGLPPGGDDDEKKEDKDPPGSTTTTTTTTSSTTSTTMPGGQQPKDCVEFSDNFKGDLEPDDYMTELDYDSQFLDDFLCDDGGFSICHVPPGNAEAAHFIEIGDSEKAVETHLAKKHVDGAKTHRSYIVKCSIYKDQKLKKSEECGVICQ